jgi:Ser/Thr protein kinase RdoA (MazF antagonist)
LVSHPFATKTRKDGAPKLLMWVGLLNCCCFEIGDVKMSGVTAHGFEGEWTRPVWPPLTLAFARQVLMNFPEAGDALDILSVSPRPFSSASVIRTEQGEVFLKRHSALVRGVEEIEEEHRFMGHLLGKGVSVPRVLRAVSGATAVLIEDAEGVWCAEVQTVPESVDLYREAISWTPFKSMEHARSAGEMLAAMHLAAVDFGEAARKTKQLISSFSIFATKEPKNALYEFLSARPLLKDYVQRSSALDEAMELLTPFHERVFPLLGELRSQWTHNDWHASNLLWSDESDVAQARSILDFGLADRTFAMNDLALAIERDIVEWLELPRCVEAEVEVPVHLDHLCALIAGYAEKRGLTRAERVALAPMTALCHAEFALSEADYFLSVLKSEAKAKLAIEGYLLGHVRWFASESGARLLNMIDDAIGEAARG